MKIKKLEAKLNRAYERLMRLEDAVKVAEIAGKWSRWTKLTEALLDTKDRIKVLECKYEILNQRMKDEEERRNHKGDSLTKIGIRLEREIAEMR